MTAAHWDALGFGIHADKDVNADGRARRYAADDSGLNHEARRTIAEATPGAVERRAAALAEIEARVPVLDRAAKRILTLKMKELHRKHRAGRLQVDHLGYGPDNKRTDVGFDVVLIPHTHQAGAAFHFSMEEIYFERRSYPMQEADRQWFVAAVKRTAGKVTGQWGASAESPGSWITVRFE